jgi:pSer/pThr/pTyr-binding forkhead associated (FHA) protein
MNVVLVMFKDNERRDFPLTEAKTVLGRRQDCHLRIPTKDVSRQHCAIIIKNEKAIARDLGSSNGTFLNGKRIAESELHPGDRLRLGPVTFVVQIDGKPTEPASEDAKSTAEPAVGAANDDETFDLSEEDFDLDAAIDDLEYDDDSDLP